MSAKMVKDVSYLTGSMINTINSNALNEKNIVFIPSYGQDIDVSSLPYHTRSNMQGTMLSTPYYNKQISEFNIFHERAYNRAIISGMVYDYPDRNVVPMIYSFEEDPSYNYNFYFQTYQLRLVNATNPISGAPILFEFNTGVFEKSRSFGLSRVLASSVYYQGHIYTVFYSYSNFNSFVLYKDDQPLILLASVETGTALYIRNVTLYALNNSLALSVYVKNKANGTSLLYYTVNDHTLNLMPNTYIDTIYNINDAATLINRQNIIPDNTSISQTAAIEFIDTMNGARLYDGNKQYLIINVNEYKSVVSWISKDGQTGLLAECYTSTPLCYRGILLAPGQLAILIAGYHSSSGSTVVQNTNGYGLYAKVATTSTLSKPDITTTLIKPPGAVAAPPVFWDPLNPGYGNVFKINNKWYALIGIKSSADYQPYIVCADMSTTSSSSDISFFSSSIGLLPNGLLPFSKALPGYDYPTASNFVLGSDPRNRVYTSAVLNSINTPYNAVGGRLSCQINVSSSESTLRGALYIYDNVREQFIIFVNNSKTLTLSDCPPDSHLFGNTNFITSFINNTGEYSKMYRSYWLSFISPQVYKYPYSDIRCYAYMVYKTTVIATLENSKHKYLCINQDDESVSS